MENLQFTPTYRPATAAEIMTFQAVVTEQSQQDIECLKAIEIRSEQRACGALLASDKQMLEMDVSDFKKINDPHLQRFAAVQIFDNTLEYPTYKAGFFEMAEKSPGLSTKVFELNAVNNELITEKEERKTMEIAMMTGAGNEIANAQVCHASTNNGQEYLGLASKVGDYFVLQKTGRNSFTLHLLSALDQLPVTEQNLAIKYRNGIGAVVNQELKRTHGVDR